jgi:hypothetical protein
MATTSGLPAPQRRLRRILTVTPAGATLHERALLSHALDPASWMAEQQLRRCASLWRDADPHDRARLKREAAAGLLADALVLEQAARIIARLSVDGWLPRRVAWDHGQEALVRAAGEMAPGASPMAAEVAQAAA